MQDNTPGTTLSHWIAITTMRAAALDSALHFARCQEERAALESLFASMPLCDLAEHAGAFYADAVRATLAARRCVPWGEQVTEELFRHFVLPLRVNNENLDAFRTACWREIVQRVSGLSVHDAVLEINHWCHERAVYQSTDIRTSGPLSTIRTGFGRCGEESTLAVSALRAACIPARQVYTPRWAHCDDNHAWVEAWVDGAWHYLGACEPEPDLDLGWFREPARRAMLVHTRVYGPYHGPEPVVSVQGACAELNLTARYAPTCEINVLVLDGAGLPVEGAAVEFRLYNTGELFPIAARVTGPGGHASMELGCGDVLIWARQGSSFGFRKVSHADAGLITLTLDADSSREYAMDLDLVPPPEPEPLPPVPGDAAGTARRIAEGDAIRARAEGSFMDEAAARALAAETGLDGDRVWALAVKSRGNWEEIAATLRAPDAAIRPWVLPLLESVSEKDLRDTPRAVFADHLNGALSADCGLSQAEPKTFVATVLCPRVDNEILTPFRTALSTALPPDTAAGARRDPSVLVSWTRRHVGLDESNDARTPISPAGVMRWRLADDHSRDIFFVALCRSLGVPARLEPSRRVPQYRHMGEWMDAALDETACSAPAGTLLLREDGGGARYGTHYTLSRFEGGQYLPLQFEEGSGLERAEVPAGHYMLVTGSRQPDGSVLAHLEFFNLGAGETRTVAIHLRRPDAAEPLGTVDTSLPVQCDGRTVTLRELGEHGGAVLVWAAQGQEPTRHAMADLRAIRNEMEAWGGALVIMPPESDGPDTEGLPRRVVFAEDGDGALQAAVSRAAGRSLGTALPAIVVMDPEGRLLFLSEGYRVGVGGQIVRAIEQAR